MGIAKVAFMGWAIVDLGLVEWVGNLVGENTGREAGDHFGNIGLVRSMQNVVVNECVVPKERELI
jgi:hypothetical protein